LKRVLVTGAGGYIGRHVVDALLQRGFDVIAADLNAEMVNQEATRISIDLFSGDPDIYEKLGTPDILIHMAWLDGFIHNSFRHVEYLPKHYKFLKNMLVGGVSQVSVMGTMHEIGYFEGEIGENTPSNPLSLYGIAKNALRQMMDIFAREYPNVVFQWLRAYYIYGDDARNHSIFAKIIEADQQGKTTFPLNSGKNLYDFISVDELAVQIAMASTQKEVTGIIECCTGKPLSLKEKVEEFISQQHLSIRPEYGAFPDRPYDSPGVWGNVEKIQKIMESVK
jgi:nucleoside-diphosphate-sugar epimerase